MGSSVMVVSSTILGDLPFSSHKAERLNAGILKPINGLGQLLLMNIAKMFLGNVDDVVVADLRFVT